MPQMGWQKDMFAPSRLSVGWQLATPAPPPPPPLSPPLRETVESEYNSELTSVSTTIIRNYTINMVH